MMSPTPMVVVLNMHPAPAAFVAGRVYPCDAPQRGDGEEEGEEEEEEEEGKDYDEDESVYAASMAIMGEAPSHVDIDADNVDVRGGVSLRRSR